MFVLLKINSGFLKIKLGIPKLRLCFRRRQDIVKTSIVVEVVACVQSSNIAMQMWTRI